MDESLEIIILRRIARYLEPFAARVLKRIGPPGAEHDMESQVIEPLFEPAEIVLPAVCPELIKLGGDMEPVNYPGIILLQFKEAHPGAVGLQGPLFLVGLKIYKPPAPGEVRERAPFG